MPKLNFLNDSTYNDWENVLQKNQQILSTFLNFFTIAEIQELRQDILDEAIKYTKLLETIAHQRGIFLHETIGYKNANKVIMTGHQPTIYHSGILAKNEELNGFAQETETTAINVLIDTDTGDGGLIYYPEMAGSQPVIKSLSITDTSPLYLYQKIGDLKQINTVFESIKKGLESFSLGEIVKKTDYANNLYIELSGLSVCQANTIVRRHLSPCLYYYELPLSTILKSRYIQTLFSKILNESNSFANIYNQSLQAYRIKHKIKNLANPFPNLKADETPFWIILPESKDRISLFNNHNAKNNLLAPKAFLITLLLRFCLSDLFIHGKGGAQYDQFLDFWVVNYYKMNAPDFVSISKDRYLFPDKIAEYEEYLSTQIQRREVSSHIDKHLNSNLFNTKDRINLTNILDIKTKLLSKLQKIENSHAKRKEIGKEIKAIDNQIKAFVTEKMAIHNEASLDSVNRDFLYFRKYPFFFFT